MLGMLFFFFMEYFSSKIQYYLFIKFYYQIFGMISVSSSTGNRGVGVCFFARPDKNRVPVEMVGWGSLKDCM